MRPCGRSIYETSWTDDNESMIVSWEDYPHIENEGLLLRRLLWSIMAVCEVMLVAGKQSENTNLPQGR